MIRYNLSEFGQVKKNKRDVVQDVKSFINSDACYNGEILVLYGLRRTGKTTIMQQVLQEYENPDKCAFYEVENSDDLTNIKQTIIKEKENGVEIIFFDEITRANDFIIDSAVLPDIFAKTGIKIVVTGTDSLGFSFADESELYDRTVRVNTTHISFAEHCRVLETDDIDDYIQYGGLMKKGEDGKRIIFDYESACKYLNSAVAENISNSIKKRSEDSCLDKLSLLELRTIIEKMVEIYSGKLSVNNAQYELKKASVNYPVNKLSGVVDSNMIYRLTLESKNITKDFARKINADSIIQTTVTNEMIATLEKYLFDMNLLSATLENSFSYTEETGWQESGSKHEYYIIQPAIKYYHLEKGKEFIEKEEYYKELSNQEKQFMQQKLDEKIKGDMTEQIIIFDTGKILPSDKYLVSKPVFYIDGKRKGEYDMLVYDKKENKYWGFEIKHTKKAFPLQEQHLRNVQFKEIIDKKYGNRESVSVLYRGESFLSETGTIYLNITEFMLAVDKYKNINKAMLELTENLPTKNISLNSDSYLCDREDDDWER